MCQQNKTEFQTGNKGMLVCAQSHDQDSILMKSTYGKMTLLLCTVGALEFSKFLSFYSIHDSAIKCQLKFPLNSPEG